nr:immunoglobulin light chain junction region [Macaca mulatta]
CQQNYNTPYSV